MGARKKYLEPVHIHHLMERAIAEKYDQVLKPGESFTQFLAAAADREYRYRERKEWREGERD